MRRFDKVLGLLLAIISLAAVFPFPRTLAASVYTTNQNVVYKNGSPIQLHGINWFGFETPDHVVHGLWARNWKDMILQMKGAGINAIRIPFCPATLNPASRTSTIDFGKNSDLSGLTSLQVLDTIVKEFNAQKMYILMDHHRPDCNAISETWATASYSETQWISDLENVATRYKDLEYFMGIDLKNEPHGSATWGTGNAATDWNLAAERAGKQVLAANPNILIFVEGIEKNPTCMSSYSHYWGENLEPQHCTPIKTSAIPANKLVLSPHIYGPDVADQPYFNDANFPGNMPTIWETQFGSLTSKGYTVIPGEWGGKYGSGNPKDKALQDALVTYYLSKKMCSSFFWDWNPNSGDTGGLLQDDWTTLWPTKLQLLQRLFNSCTTPTQTSIPTTGPTIQPTATGLPTVTEACVKKPFGDANCDGRINLNDFERFRQEYTGLISTKTSDFNNDNRITLIDFEIWRRNFTS